jgi:murein DD-endopeptidase MepM/ murein hydrolase activator NlpD
VLASGIPAGLTGQGVRVEWYGATPAQGAFAYVVVTDAPGPVSVQGTLGDLPLTFVRVGADRFAALAGVAVDAPDSVDVRLQLEYARGHWAEHAARLPVRRTRFPVERLRVDPAFTRPPDSALAERIAREGRRAREVAAAALRTPRLWRGAFEAPRVSRVTSVFGMGRLFNGQVRSRHFGTDFDGSTGAPVRVANRGVVALVGDFYYAGRVVYVNHGAGLSTAYLHLSDVSVQEGDTVATGQRIGKVGQSGRVTGPHLHWAVRFSGIPVDGASLLALPPLERLFDR